MTPEQWLEEAQERCPPGFRLDEKGLYEGESLLSCTPFTASAMLRDAIGHRFARVEFIEGDEVLQVPVAWEALGGPAGLDVLTPYAVDLGRHNAGAVGAYLRRLVLDPETPFAEVQVQAGWSRKMDSFFLDASPGFVHPLALGALSTAGDFDGWLSVARQAMGSPRLAAAIYAAILPPLQKILGAPNFAVCWAGGPSIGKSTAAALGASVWGNPDPIGGTWVGLGAQGAAELQGIAQSRSDLPIILDDLGFKEAPAVLEAVLLGRGPLGVSWRTVALTSSPGAWFSPGDGSALEGRLVMLWGSPFGAQGPEEAMQCAALAQGIQDHHGHLGPAFVDAILEHPGLWDGWKRGYRAAVSLYAAVGAKRGGIGGRIGTHLAALATAGTILHQLMPQLPGDPQALMDDLWRWMLTSGQAASRAEFALDLITQLARSRKRRMWSRAKAEANKPVPSQGWVGMEVTDLNDPVHIIHYIRLNIVESVLREAGLDPGPIYREWISAGLVLGTERVWSEVTIDGANQACVGFRDLY